MSIFSNFGHIWVKKCKIGYILLAKRGGETRNAAHIFPASGVVSASVLIGFTGFYKGNE